MGWETRNGRRYYYEAERVGRRVVKRYVGTGPLAQCCADLAAITRERQKLARVDAALAAARRSRPGIGVRLVAAADLVLKQANASVLSR